MVGGTLRFPVPSSEFGVQKLNRQLLVLPGKLLEIRSSQLILDPPDFPLQLGDPLVVVRQLQPEHDAGVSGVKRPHGPVPDPYLK